MVASNFMIKILKDNELISPHLPKEVRQKGKGEMFWRSPINKTLLIAVLFGFFSGAVGGIVINARLIDDWLWGPDGLMNSHGRVAAGQSRVLPRDVLAKKTSGALVTFYHPVVSLKADALPAPEEAVGAGFAITSDGWLAAAAESIGKYSRKELTVVTAENKILSLEKIIIDPASDLVLVKVSGGRFSSLPFVSGDNLETGQNFWLPSFKEGLRPAELLIKNQFSPKSKSEWHLSSEKLYRLALLKETLTKNWLGAPVVNNQGEVAGILLEPARFLRAALIESALSSVIKDKVIKRPYLGVRFVERGEILGSEEKQGVKLTSVDKKSPLWLLGIRPGDVLFSIGGEVITASRSLPDILVDYQPGAKVEAKYWRGTEEKIVIVELGINK